MDPRSPSLSCIHWNCRALVVETVIPTIIVNDCRVGKGTASLRSFGCECFGVFFVPKTATICRHFLHGYAMIGPLRLYNIVDINQPSEEYLTSQGRLEQYLVQESRS